MKQQMIEWTCDGCSSSKILHEDEKPIGFHGTIGKVLRSDSAATTEWEWYACGNNCVDDAVGMVMGKGFAGNLEP